MKACYATILFCIVFFSSCKKPAGEGGNSSIRGKVWVKQWDKYYTQIVYQYFGSDVDVYIIYGDDISYSDKTSTNYNGEFEFKYLRKGNYKVYAFSTEKQDTINPSGTTTTLVQTKISKNKQTVDIGTLEVKQR
jgi:hypothetical protein